MEADYLIIKEEDGRISIVTRIMKKGEWFPVSSVTISKDQAVKLHEDLTEALYDQYYV